MPVFPSYDFIDAAALSTNADRRHHRPPERREVVAVQPDSWAATTAIVSGRAGDDARPPFRAAEWAGRGFWLVDTGGLVEDAHLPMDVAIREQVLQAIDEADLLLFVVDAKAGLQPSDARILDLLRAQRKPWLLVANKVDDPASTDFYEFYELGAGDPIPVSAANGKNSGDLLDAVVAHIPSTAPAEGTELRSPWSAGPMSASPRSSTGCSARIGSSCLPTPARRETRSTRR